MLLNINSALLVYYYGSHMHLIYNLLYYLYKGFNFFNINKKTNIDILILDYTRDNNWIIIDK